MEDLVGNRVFLKQIGESVSCSDATGNDGSIALRSMDAALHDLSQPLTSIALALEVLAHERDPEMLEAMLVAAREECSRAMRDVAMLRTQTNRMLTLWNDAGRG